MHDPDNDHERGTFAHPGYRDKLEDTGGLLDAARRRPEALEGRCRCGHTFGDHRPVSGHPCSSCECLKFVHAESTVNGRSRPVLANAKPGARLYAVDETGDGWRLIVAVDSMTHGGGSLSAHAVCETLKVGEWSSWRPVIIDGVEIGATVLTMMWTEDEHTDVPPREHVVALDVVIEGWN